ncbi:hypothetical protein [Bosea sp. ANAM02]|uniref:hypothetical protein n=1 Tax=Bosea sp. ANAM02 TaxID=2020412 RepID=UPI00140F4409|nr:hypothetical protein [Bosea sp. ANAM02]BCB18026.1 hypothetical protein OCUBac02_09200 [Bosea sp. ANAM02]
MIWSQTASGRPLDLLAPIPPDGLDLRRDIATPLGMTGRYANQMPSGIIYPVAQHCCIGADTIYAASHDPAAALAFLLHDGHEAIIGDWATPIMVAMQAAADRLAPGSGVSIKAIKRELCAPIDAWLHRLAGLPWPLPVEIARTVALTDVRLMLAERDHLLARPPRPWGVESYGTLKLKHRIVPLSPARATEQWLTRFDRWSEAVLARPAPKPKSDLPPSTRRAGGRLPRQPMEA